MSGIHGRHVRHLAPRSLSLVLSALIVAGPLARASAAADEPSGAAVAVQSDPAGADVYVDGRFVGKTPLQADKLSSGDHRVRVVKAGYLENARIVNLSTDKPRTVDVKLTPDAGAGTPQAATSGGDAGKKWLWIGLAGGGAAGAALFLMNRNTPPLAGTIGVSPAGAGMAGITTYTFSSAGASDPNDDALTYTWDFGDGTSATGSTVTKVFANSGAYSISLAVSDGKETVVAPTAGVTVLPSMAGTWTGGYSVGWGAALGVTLTQTGTSLGGTVTFSGGIDGQFSIAGTGNSVGGTTYPTSVTFQTVYNVAGYTGTFTTRFAGTVDATGNSMTGTCFDESDFHQNFQNPCTFRR